MSSKPKIAILCWERGTVPAGLMQMEEQLGFHIWVGRGKGVGEDF